jgi:hypothetical protein
MSFKSDDNLMIHRSTNISKHANDKLRGISLYKKLTMSKLIAIAIDNELSKPKPFELDLTLPDLDDYEEFAFADQACILVDYMRKLRVGAGLDVLMLLRHDIGLPDPQQFLCAFAECLKNEVIEPFLPKPKLGMPEYPKDYFYYRVKQAISKKVVKRRTKEYDRYLKLKDRFKNEEIKEEVKK